MEGKQKKPLILPAVLLGIGIAACGKPGVEAARLLYSY